MSRLFIIIAAAILLVTGMGIANAQLGAGTTNPAAQPNTQLRDQSGTPGTGSQKNLKRSGHKRASTRHHHHRRAHRQTTRTHG